jgi:hypothetical protein
MTRQDLINIQGSSTSFKVRDINAHPPLLYNYVFATIASTATLTGRFVDSSGRNIVINPGAVLASQISAVALVVTTTPQTFKDLIVAAAIAGVTDIPANAVGFRGTASSPFYFNTTATRDTNGAESFITPIADYTPTNQDDPVPADNGVIFGRVAAQAAGALSGGGGGGGGDANAANQATQIGIETGISNKLPPSQGQKTMTQSLAVVIASNQSSIPVDMDGMSFQIVPTIGGGAYSIGDCIGGILDFVGMQNIAARNVEIDQIYIQDKSKQHPDLFFEFFSATPAGAGHIYTNNLAVVYGTSDETLSTGVVRLKTTDWQDLPLVAATKSVACLSDELAFSGLAASDLFMLIHCNGTPTWNAGDLIITVTVKHL